MWNEKPRGVSLPFWKHIFASLVPATIFIFLIWLMNSVVYLYYTGSFSRPLKISDVLLGSGPILMAPWARWVWHPKRKYAHWHRWFYTLVSTLYLSVLVLLLPLTYWTALFTRPWGMLINSILVLLFIVGWILPFVFYPLAKKVTETLRLLNVRLFPFVGLLTGSAGVSAAIFGMRASRNGEGAAIIAFVAFLGSFVALYFAVMSSEIIWRYRPWAKEGE